MNTQRKNGKNAWLRFLSGRNREARRLALLADRKPPWLDITEFPGRQDADEQQHRQPDADRERARHVGAFGAIPAPAPEHEKQRRSQTRQNADEGQRHEVFHAADYRPGKASRAIRRAFVTLLAWTLIAAGIGLGRWQLSRAAHKKALQAGIQTQARLSALTQDDFLALPHPMEALHRTVRLRGLWIAPQTVYLDNRQMHGRPGFYVLTPFALEGHDVVVMVQRGWVPRNFKDRTQLAPVRTPPSVLEIVGHIAPPPAQLLALSPESPLQTAESSELSSPAIRQNLDLETFRTETGLPLHTDFSVQQSGLPSEGLQRDWPAPTLDIEKHYGYAFQWFSLAGLVAILYLWFQLITPIRHARTRPLRHL